MSKKVIKITESQIRDMIGKAIQEQVDQVQGTSVVDSLYKLQDSLRQVASDLIGIRHDNRDKLTPEVGNSIDYYIHQLAKMLGGKVPGEKSEYLSIPHMINSIEKKGDVDEQSGDDVSNDPYWDYDREQEMNYGVEDDDREYKNPEDYEEEY